jgi:uncharacterized protein YkwD
MRIFFIFITAIIITSSGAFAQDFQITDDENSFLSNINIEREAVGLDPLMLNPLLTQTAREHSKEMCDLKYFGHISPTDVLKSPMKRYLKNVGHTPDYVFIGENLFYCSIQDAQLGHKSLMESKGHRDNILNPKFEEVGIGIYVAPDGEYYVTQMFLKQTDTKVKAPDITPAVSAPIQVVASYEPGFKLPSLDTYLNGFKYTHQNNQRDWFQQFNLNSIFNQI